MSVDGRDPDAFVVLHHPKDGGEPYGIGPFPPLDELAEQVMAGQQCDCSCRVLWIAFPKGIRMAVFAIEGVNLMPEPADGPVH